MPRYSTTRSRRVPIAEFRGAPGPTYCTTTTNPAVTGHRSSGVLSLPECSFCHRSLQKLPRPYQQAIGHRRTCCNPGVLSAFFLRLRPGPVSQNLSATFQVPEKLSVTPCVIAGPANQPGSHRSPQDLLDLPRALVINFGNCRCRVGRACTVTVGVPPPSTDIRSFACVHGEILGIVIQSPNVSPCTPKSLSGVFCRQLRM